MTTRRNAILGLVGFGAFAAAGSPSAVTATRPGTAFGTGVRLTVTAATKSAAEAALDAGYHELRAVHAAASLFDPASELSRLNRDGMPGNPSAVFRDLSRWSDTLWNETDGAFDASVQPLWALWQAALSQRRQPLRDEIASALAVVGWRGLDSHGLPRLRANGSAFTFNGIAQGYAADRVMRAFASHGAISGFADTGELAIASGNGDSPARLAIRDPRRAGSTLGTLEVESGFVATSGDYVTAFSDDFRHHHIFNPVSGSSPTDLASVTVTAPTGARADGLATAFMVMGVDRSLAYVARNEDVGAMLVTKTGDIHVSTNLRYQT